MAPALLLLLGAAAVLGADFPPGKTFSILPPVNFTIEEVGLAQVLLRWDANPDQPPVGMKLGYHVRINAREAEDYETKNTASKRTTELHRGLSASVRTIPWDGPSVPASAWASARLPAPPGSPGTSAVNLTCTTTTAADNATRSSPYRVSLRCAWLAGREAPEDTQYFLYYRYGSQTEGCRGHSRDARKRDAACWFPRTFIDGKGRDPLAVRVNGSSTRAVIQPLDQLFALHAIDQVNCPGNVTAEREGTTRLSIRWEKPVSAFPAHCFDYEVRIHSARNGYVQTEKVTSDRVTTTVNDNSKHGIEVRAAVSAVCRKAGLWSEWSPPVYVGSDEQKPWAEWALVAAMAAACTCILGSLAWGMRCRLWTVLFPPVPAPKSIHDFAGTVNYEKTGSGETESEVISYVEEWGLGALEDPVF